MQIIPTQATPNQTLGITLNNQICQINVYAKSTGLFLDLYSNGSLVIGGVLGINSTPIVITPYLGFVGDLIFWDTTGAGDDPVYTGLGDQFVLLYLLPSEFSAFAAQVQAENLAAAIAALNPMGNFIFGLSGFGTGAF